jgi:hypothetical protein
VCMAGGLVFVAAAKNQLVLVAHSTHLTHTKASKVSRTSAEIRVS